MALGRPPDDVSENSMRIAMFDKVPSPSIVNCPGVCVVLSKAGIAVLIPEMITKAGSSAKLHSVKLDTIAITISLSFVNSFAANPVISIIRSLFFIGSFGLVSDYYSYHK